MVERDTGATRLYVQQDANWNLTGVVSTAGVVQERFVYDPYGAPSTYDRLWNPIADQLNWVYLHQGGRYDGTSGLYYFCNRDYSPTLGRWMQLDPVGYATGDNNLYENLNSSPQNFLDPLGLQKQSYPIRSDGTIPVLMMPDGRVVNVNPSDLDPDLLRYYRDNGLIHDPTTGGYRPADFSNFIQPPNMPGKDSALHMADPSGAGWRLVWVLQKSGEYRELYSQEAEELRALRGKVPPTQLQALRGALKDKYQKMSPPEVDRALKAIFGDKYEKRVATGSINPEKTNAGVNSAFRADHAWRRGTRLGWGHWTLPSW